MADAALLQVRDLRVRFAAGGRVVHAVNAVSFDLDRGRTLGLVGESGCGKSATLRALAGLLPGTAQTAGSVALDGERIDGLTAERRSERIAMVFQDPATHLDPVQRVGDALVETLRVRRGLDRRAAAAQAVELLERVEIPQAKERFGAYPHQLSGGQRQRVMIALALACDPVLLLADEPTTALDVTTQRRVLALLKRLQEESGMSMVFVSHDLAVIAETCDTAAVMYAGCIVERGPAAELLERPAHPYAEGLIRSIPTLDPRHRVEPIPGAPPDLSAPLRGCPFRPRCPRATDECEAYDVVPDARERFAACIHPLGASTAVTA